MEFGALVIYCWLTVISSAKLTKRRENGHGSYKEKTDSGTAEMSDNIREVKVVEQ